MATAPAYASVPNLAGQLLTAAEASYTAPTTTLAVLTAGASGTRLNRVVVKGVATTVAGKVLLFLFDGTTYHLFDEIDITAITLSTTVDSFRLERAYTDVVIKTGWSLRAGLSVAQTGVKVIAFGGDL